ncbi:MAG: Tfp pilus assembly protein FimT/FimU [Planctomycetota bacterium]
MNRMSTGRTRGVTLVELIVTVVVMALIGTPLIIAMSNMATSERQTAELADTAYAIRPLAVAFQEMVRNSSADTVAAPNNPAFVCYNGNTTLRCHITPNPYDLGTYTPLGLIWFDAPNQTIWVQYVYPSAQAAWPAATNITDCRFYLGPTGNVESNSSNNNYADRELLNNRSVLMEVTINVNGRPLQHKVIAFSPNVK